MVILVDDEEDRDGEREQDPYRTLSDSRSGSNNTTEAPLWDDSRQRADSSGVSTGIGSDTAETQISDEVGRFKTRRPMFRQRSEMGDSAQQPFAIGPGPMVGGRAFSGTSNSDQHISVDEGKRAPIGGPESRPTSQGSTFVPIQSTMQPRVKIAGRSSFEADAARKAPINMPGRSDAERETRVDPRPSARRTYKSLSPYGVLFED